MQDKISAEKIKEIKAGIAAYDKEQEALLELIRKTNGLTASKFDETFSGAMLFSPRGGIEGDSFMLGLGQNGFTEWAWQLDLLQHMMSIGLVDTTTNEDNEIVYILP